MTTMMMMLLLRALRDSQGPAGIWVVGGAVRDRLIGRDPSDLDVVVVGPALRLARALADRVGGSFYILDARREFGRVVWRSPEGRRFRVDLTRRDGLSWEEDLRRRDFTINFEAPERLIRPAPLIRGGDLLSLGAPEGPQIGRILEAIREAQAAGEVATREEALALARRLLGRG